MVAVKETELVIPMLAVRDIEYAYFGENIPKGKKRINVTLTERLANRLSGFESFGGTTATENLERFIILKLYIDSQQPPNDFVSVGNQLLEIHPVNLEKMYSGHRINAELPILLFELTKVYARAQRTIYNNQVSYSKYIREALYFGFRSIDAAENQGLLFLSSCLPITVAGRNFLFLI